MPDFGKWFAGAARWLSSRASARPAGESRLPDGVAVYAIGDIHGELGLLSDLLERIRADAEALPADTRRILIFIGDYVDRGPDSRGVVELLCGDPLPGFERCFLLGNHEQALLDFLRDPSGAAPWLEFGGLATLDSYGVRPGGGGADRARLVALRDALLEKLPPRHIEWLSTLETKVAFGDYGFVHAGIRPGIPWDRQVPEDLLWIRSPFLGSRRRHPLTIVHGHTIVAEAEILPNRIAIDTGAYAGGALTAVALYGSGRRVLQARRRGTDNFSKVTPSDVE